MKVARNRSCIIFKVGEENGPMGSSPDCPRYETGDSGHVGSLYGFVGRWLLKNGIRYVVGPVCSGSVMAYAISAISGGQLKAVFAPKVHDNYRPRVHAEDPTVGGPYVVVDDVLDSGEEIMNTIKWARGKSGQRDPSAVLCFNCMIGAHGWIERDFPSVPIFKMAFRG